jgi:hypothetical protein
MGALRICKHLVLRISKHKSARGNHSAILGEDAGGADCFDAGTLMLDTLQVPLSQPVDLCKKSVALRDYALRCFAEHWMLQHVDRAGKFPVW